MRIITGIAAAGLALAACQPTPASDDPTRAISFETKGTAVYAAILTAKGPARADPAKRGVPSSRALGAVLVARGAACRVRHGFETVAHRDPAHGELAACLWATGGLLAGPPAVITLTATGASALGSVWIPGQVNVTVAPGTPRVVALPDDILAVVLVALPKGGGVAACEARVGDAVVKARSAGKGAAAVCL